MRFLPDGTHVKPGEVVMEVVGEAKRVLAAERTALNLLSHMSGVATLTRKAVEKAKAVNPRVRVAATRKTLPGLRYFEKKAVAIGGGDPHRYDLSDMILIKDNHIRIVGDVEKAVRLARERASFTKKIEVEVRSAEEALKAARAGADIVMLDNVDVEEVKKAIELLKAHGLRDKVLVEVSGGITLENIDKYAATGVDIISMGMLTHSAKAIDFSLDVVEVVRGEKK